MEEGLSKRVRAAAIAGWWTLAVAVGFGLLLGLASIGFLSCRPDWVVRFWGPDITWATIYAVTLWMFAVYKVFTLILLIVAVWLSLWARRLRKAGL
jgi:hypothetical protein